MTSRGWEPFRGSVAVVLAVLISCAGARGARAAEPDSPASSAEGQASGNPSSPTPGGEDKPSEAAAVPQLQLQDEGPPARSSANLRVARSRAALTDETEDKPFWKSWIFWTVTGVLVAGAVGLLVYTSSARDSSLAPCPADVLVSLGCYGAGRK